MYLRREFVFWQAKQSEIKTKLTCFIGARLSIPVFVKSIPNGESFRMALRSGSALRASRPPVKKKTKNISSGRLLWARASSWIPELRCAPLSPRLVKINPKGKSFRMPLRSDLRCAPLGPCLENHLERKLVFW